MKDINEDTIYRKKRQFETLHDKLTTYTKRLKIQVSTIPSEEQATTSGTDDYKTKEKLSDTEVDVLEVVVREDLLHQKQIEKNAVLLHSSPEEKLVGDIINTLLEF